MVGDLPTYELVRADAGAWRHFLLWLRVTHGAVMIDMAPSVVWELYGAAFATHHAARIESGNQCWLVKDFFGGVARMVCYDDEGVAHYTGNGKDAGGPPARAGGLI